MDDLIAQLVQKLDLTAEEITDILWLALLQWQSIPRDSEVEEDESIKKVPEKQQKKYTNLPSGLLVYYREYREYREASPINPPPIPEKKTNKPNPPQPSNSPNLYRESSPKVPIYPRNYQSNSPSTPTQESLPFPVPNAKAIRNSLALLRSLRPLMVRIPSPTASVLDENATAQWIAETKIWFPQSKPLPEAWFELALIIDASPSMLIWQRHVLEMRRLLAQTGAFRDLRTWSLQVNSEGKLCLYPKLGGGINQENPSTPEELIDPNRRRLILVVSDCISPIWQSGIITKALQVWAENGPMALVQMLPEWLWDRTALSEVTKVQFYSLAPGMVNQKLSVRRRNRWRKTNPLDIKVPVLTLDPEITHLWSQMVAGKGKIGIPGLLFSPVAQTSFTDSEDEIRNLSSGERVEHFRIFSSPMARRLAGLLAGSPVISLPIIRIIQDAMLPQSQQVHVAEVLLSGLFKLATPIEVETNSDEIEYKFYEEDIRQILLDSTPAPDTFSVLSRWIEQRLGKSMDDFISILQNPQSNSELAESMKPFAGIAIEVLKRQGGEYSRFATDLEKRSLLQQVGQQLQQYVQQQQQYGQQQQQYEQQPQVLAEEAIPPLQTFDFEVATIAFDTETSETETPPQFDLQPFQFKVATIQLKQTGRVRKQKELIINYHQQEAFSFTEDLWNGVQLEMVAIPEGSFMMGSPEDELEHRNSESPQHLVTIKPFFMGKYPVTQAQWQAVASLSQVNRKLNPNLSRFQGENRPVERVSWYDAVEFCSRLSIKTGHPYRLPSEAEWEYACRAGTTTTFHFGETISTDLANYDGTINKEYGWKGSYGKGKTGIKRGETTPVGSFGVANDFGLYDMHGNVWEWCGDKWHDNYKGAPIDGSVWGENNENDNHSRLLRGGSWYSYPGLCRSAFRIDFNPGDRHGYYIGFRVVCGVAWTL